MVKLYTARNSNHRYAIGRWIAIATLATLQIIVWSTPGITQKLFATVLFAPSATLGIYAIAMSMIDALPDYPNRTPPSNTHTLSNGVTVTFTKLPPKI